MARSVIFFFFRQFQIGYEVLFLLNSHPFFFFFFFNIVMRSIFSVLLLQNSLKKTKYQTKIPDPIYASLCLIPL